MYNNNCKNCYYICEEYCPHAEDFGINIMEEDYEEDEEFY